MNKFNMSGIGTLGAILAFFGIVGASVYGWVHNIVILGGMMNGQVTAEFIIRCVGIFFAPLGIILGYY